jgi:LysR family transcriptional regulator, chromosome initiation inhibitor
LTAINSEIKLFASTSDFLILKACCAMSTFDPDALECLAVIVEEGGFERAAQRLSITQSAVSQRLRSLEAQVGTVLIVRSRPLKATSAGQLLLKHTKQMRLLRADLERDLKELAPSSSGAREEERVSIAINADSIATWALDALGPLVREGLPLEIITDDQDFTQEWLREGQVLGCVTTLKQALRGCKVVPLGAMHYIAVSSINTGANGSFDPQKGLNAHNFKDIPFIAFNRKDDMQSEFVAKAFGLKRVSLRQLFVPSSQAQVRAVQAGWGVSVVPQLLAQPHVDAGELVNLLPGFTLPVQLYWHCWNLESEVLDGLTQAIKDSAAAKLQ